jgi:hypothetical protein
MFDFSSVIDSYFFLCLIIKSLGTINLSSIITTFLTIPRSSTSSPSYVPSLNPRRSISISPKIVDESIPSPVSSKTLLSQVRPSFLSKRPSRLSKHLILPKIKHKPRHHDQDGIDLYTSPSNTPPSSASPSVVASSHSQGVLRQIFSFFFPVKVRVLVDHITEEKSSRIRDLI